MHKILLFAAAAVLFTTSVSCEKIGGNDEKNNPYKSLELSTKSAEFVQKGSSFSVEYIDRINDVTPGSYPFGEPNDAYARAAIGQLGERHYLTMDINRSPTHYNLATLRDATDAMLAHGCVKAYALDGGETAHTVFNGKVINPLQKGVEKNISDALCFVSAYPDD